MLARPAHRNLSNSHLVWGRLPFRNVDRVTELSDSRNAQLYSVSYYGVSGSSLAAGVNASRLKKPHRRKQGLQHQISANSIRVVDCDFAFHASDFVPHGSAIRWNWRGRGLCGSDQHFASLWPGIAAASATCGCKTAAGSGAYADPRQWRLAIRPSECSKVVPFPRFFA